MSKKDPDLLKTSIKKRLADAQRHLFALEAAVAEFGTDFEAEAFETAWLSTEPAEIHRAYAVQAGYENVINAVITVGNELCELKGWSSGSADPSSVETLRLLHENGVIDGQVRQKLKDAQELRSDVQHDYANVAAREVHEAVRLVLDAAPLMIQDAALEVR